MVKEINTYQFSKPFKKQYQGLPRKIQDAFHDKLKLLLDNPRHPSLRVKKIQGTKNIWEGSITMHYRFTFHVDGNTAVFRAIGTHDILLRE